PVLEDEAMTGEELVDAAEHRVAAGRVARAEDFGQHVVVRLRRDEIAGEDRLDLRAEEQRVAHARPVERLDAEAIADEEQPPLRRVPDREREHAAEAMDALLAPFLVGMDDRLGVAPGAVDVTARFEIGADDRSAAP